MSAFTSPSLRRSLLRIVLFVALVAGVWALGDASPDRALLTLGLVALASVALFVNVQLFRQTMQEAAGAPVETASSPATTAPAIVAPIMAPTADDALDSRLRDLVRHVPGVVYQFKLREDGTAYFPYASSAMKDLFGLDPAEVREDAREVFARMHPEDRPRVVEKVFGVTRSGGDWCDEFRVVHPEKGVRWVSVRSTAKRDSDGTPVWNGVVMDISAIKEAVGRAQAASQMLEQAQEMLRLGSWSFDVATRQTTWSKQVFRIFGRDQAQGAPDHPGSYAYFVDEDARRLDDAVTQAVAGGTSYSLLLRLKEPHDGIAVVRAAGQASLDEKGQASRLFGTLIDVTAVVEREEELRAAQHAAEAANQSKSEFLANMSHEIRTPMTAILGYVDLLSSPSISRGEHHEYVSTIQRNADHLLQLINDILDLSKIEAGQMTVERIACSPAAIARDIVSLLRPRAEEKGLSLELKFEGLIPSHIQSDPTRLRQILVNLVGNAVKFTAEGGVVVTVYMGKRDGDESEPSLNYDVKDSGIGMSAVEKKGLFRPFTQADTSTTRRFGGTGLGLSVANRLAHMLGGSINVESAPRLGSLFTARVATGDLAGVPFGAGLTEATDDASSEMAASAEGQSPLAGKRIFLAEDGPDNRRLIWLYLTRAGATVEMAENGQLAVDRLTAPGAAFDAVLMDMQMPVLDGYRATSRLRSSGYSGPIVALTAHAMDGDRERCLRAGCDDYATKPIHAPTLVATLARHTAGGQAATPIAATTITPIVAVASSSFSADEAIYSTFADDPDMVELIDQFVGMLPERIASVENAVATGNREALGRAVHQLRGAGGSFGFAQITEAAHRVELQLHAMPPSESELDRAIAVLVTICRLARAPQLPAAAPLLAVSA